MLKHFVSTLSLSAVLLSTSLTAPSWSMDEDAPKPINTAHPRMQDLIASTPEEMENVYRFIGNMFLRNISKLLCDNITGADYHKWEDDNVRLLSNSGIFEDSILRYNAHPQHWLMAPTSLESSITHCTYTPTFCFHLGMKRQDLQDFEVLGRALKPNANNQWVKRIIVSPSYAFPSHWVANHIFRRALAESYLALFHISKNDHYWDLNIFTQCEHEK